MNTECENSMKLKQNGLKSVLESIILPHLLGCHNYQQLIKLHDAEHARLSLLLAN